jgi:hypothetical protein
VVDPARAGDDRVSQRCGHWRQCMTENTHPECASLLDPLSRYAAKRVAAIIYN